MVNRRLRPIFDPFDSPIHKSCNAVNGKAGNGPGRDDPQRRTFSGVVMPEVGLRAPAFNGEPATDANKDDEQVGLEIRARHNGDRHKKEDANKQPVYVTPPGTIPINIGKIFFCKGPPDVDDQKDRDEKTAQQDG